jgi:hypothetical protein
LPRGFRHRSMELDGLCAKSTSCLYRVLLGTFISSFQIWWFAFLTETYNSGRPQSDLNSSYQKIHWSRSSRILKIYMIGIPYLCPFRGHNTIIFFGLVPPYFGLLNWLDDLKPQLLTRAETPRVPTNFFFRTTSRKPTKPI